MTPDTKTQAVDHLAETAERSHEEAVEALLRQVDVLRRRLVDIAGAAQDGLHLPHSILGSALGSDPAVLEQLAARYQASGEALRTARWLRSVL